MKAPSPRTAPLAASIFCLLVATALVPAASAQGLLEADRVTLSGGTSMADGELVALVMQVQPNVSDYDGADIARLVFAGQEIRVEVDEVEDGPAAAGVGVGGGPTKRDYTVHNGTGSAAPAQAVHDLAVLARPGRDAPTIRWASQGGEATPGSGQYSMEDRVGTGRSTTTDLDASVAWKEQAPAPTLRIEGDFMLALWEWDLDLQGDEGRHHEPTGSRSDAPSALPILVQSESARNQAYLTVTDGVLEITGLPLRLTSLHLSNLKTQGDTAALAGVLGTLPGGRSIEATSLALTGELHFTFEALAPKGALAVGLHGEITSAQADGVLLSIVLGDPGGWSRYWPWMMVLGAAVVTPAGVVGAQAAQHRRQSHRMEDLEFLVRGGHLAQALAVADDLALSKAYADDALLLKADALLQLGRPDATLRLLDRVWNPSTQATAACLRGIALSRLQRGTEAVEQLRTAFRSAPHLVARARADPAAGLLLRDPRLQAAAGAWT